mgnify:CR=1 FL=1
MSRSLLLAVAAFALTSPAWAQGTSETVDLNLNIRQPSLFDSDARDSFSGVVDDRMGTTSLDVVCSAGASA